MILFQLLISARPPAVRSSSRRVAGVAVEADRNLADVLDRRKGRLAFVSGQRRPGWDRAAWGMTVSEITAVYGDRALRLASPIVFGDSYAQIVLRDPIFAGYPFRVYFQMDPATL